jgi:putative selenium metabolism protein SsnA
LRVANERIVSIGADVQAQPGDEVVDCGGAVLMPGFVNGHTHLYSSLAVGMPSPPRPPRNFHEILQFIWWRLDRAHTLESVETSGRIGALAALRCGTTTLIDHHASPNAIEGSLSALETGIAAAGCRAVLCYEVTDRNGPNEAVQGVTENERFLRECRRRADGRFAAMVGAHASFTLEEDSLAACVDLAKRQALGMHIHAAEDPIDERITRERFRCGLFERFARVGLFDLPGTILAHGTHFSTDDLAVVNNTGYISIAHNPSSNMNNGVGYAPVAKLEVPPLLGTDGIGADMWGEARVAEFKSRDAGRPLKFGSSLDMLGLNALFASNYLGMRLGALQRGAAADLVLTMFRPASPLRPDNIASHCLYAMGPQYVRHVMIAGRWCLKEGVVVSCDEAKIRVDAMSVARSLHERMAAIK